jgi:hypothetical protein
MPTFGDTTAYTLNAQFDGYKAASKFTLTEAGTVEKLTAYIGVIAGGPSDLQAGIYADSAGEPGARLAVTTIVSQAGTSGIWLDLPFASPLHLPPGDYWLAIDSGTTPVAWSVEYALGATAAASRYNSGSGLSDPFGGATSYIGPVSIYATYAPVFPATPILDTFIRADGGIGADYTTAPANAGGGSFNISGNQIANAGFALASAWRNVATVGPDTETYITCPTLPSGTFETFGLYARLQAPGTAGVDGYLLLANVEDSNWAIYRYNDAAQTYLNSSAHTWLAGDMLRLEVTGTTPVTLNVYRKRSGVVTLLGTVLDADASRITAAGYIGIHMYDSAGTGRLKDFGGGTLLPFPSTPILDDFNRTESPLNFGGKWGTHPQGGQANMEANGSMAQGVASGEGGQIWTELFSAPYEMHFNRAVNYGHVYFYFGLQPGSENGTGTLDCYMLTIPGFNTVVVVNRMANESPTTIIDLSGQPAPVGGDVYGIRHEANGALSVYRNGGKIGEAADLTYLGPGYIGAYASASLLFDDWGGGSMLVPQAIRPDADIDTTGWATAPLWSKIEEETADGTVITATSS